MLAVCVHGWCWVQGRVRMAAAAAETAAEEEEAAEAMVSVLVSVIVLCGECEGDTHPMSQCRFDDRRKPCRS